MTDVFSSQKRSEIMGRVRGCDNKLTEFALRDLFRRSGITGWRRRARVFGKPDFVFPRQRIALFVDGCFWHACPQHGSHPATNKSFWRRKLSRNQDRDRVVNRSLKQRGWRVVRIWQHELKSEAALLRRIRRVLRAPLSTAQHTGVAGPAEGWRRTADSSDHLQ